VSTAQIGYERNHCAGYPARAMRDLVEWPHRNAARAQKVADVLNCSVRGGHRVLPPVKPEEVQRAAISRFRGPGQSE
jgi:hypothetical protein